MTGDSEKEPSKAGHALSWTDNINSTQQVLPLWKIVLNCVQNIVNMITLVYFIHLIILKDISFYLKKKSKTWDNKLLSLVN